MGVSKFLRPSNPAPIWLLLLVVACIAVSFVSLIDFKRQTDSWNEVAQQVVRLKTAVRPKPRPSKADDVQREQWAKLSAERGFDWYPIFLALERASTGDIELLEFQPDKANKQLRLRGEARDMKALASYLERLSAQRTITEAYLSHQKKTERDAIQVVAFEIRATLSSGSLVSNLQH